MLRAFVLAFHDNAAGKVRQPHRGIGLVDMLAARAGRAEGVDPEVGGVDVDLFDSSGSGRTATVQADVWIRPCDSVAGTRCTRCAPDSNFRRAKILVPLIRHTTSL